MQWKMRWNNTKFFVNIIASAPSHFLPGHMYKKLMTNKHFHCYCIAIIYSSLVLEPAIILHATGMLKLGSQYSNAIAVKMFIFHESFLYLWSGRKWEGADAIILTKIRTISIIPWIFSLHFYSSWYHDDYKSMSP